MKCLLAAKVVHGDICERNVCIYGKSIQLIDIGEVVTGRQNDVVESGELLLWCIKTMTLTNEEKETISRAASELVRREKLDAALVMLEEIELLKYVAPTFKGLEIGQGVKQSDSVVLVNFSIKYQSILLELGK